MLAPNLRLRGSFIFFGQCSMLNKVFFVLTIIFFFIFVPVHENIIATSKFKYLQT